MYKLLPTNVKIFFLHIIMVCFAVTSCMQLEEESTKSVILDTGTQTLVLENSASNMTANDNYDTRLWTIEDEVHTTIQADVSMDSSTKSSSGQTRALVELAFQPDEYRGGGNQTGKTFARMEIRDQNSGTVLRAFAMTCGDSVCSRPSRTNYPLSNTGGFTDGQPIGKNKIYTFGIQYVSGGEFIMSFNDGSGVVTETINMSFPAAVFNEADFRRTGLGVRTKDSTEGQSGSVSATFDNVVIDGSLYDDFSNVSLDATKWSSSTEWSTR